MHDPRGHGGDRGGFDQAGQADRALSGEHHPHRADAPFADSAGHGWQHAIRDVHVARPGSGGRVHPGAEDQFPQLGLAGDDEAVVQSDIATIETQLSSPRPKMEIIKESLRSIRNIAEGAVGSLAASGIIAGIAKLLGM